MRLACALALRQTNGAPAMEAPTAAVFTKVRRETERVPRAGVLIRISSTCVCRVRRDRRLWPLSGLFSYLERASDSGALNSRGEPTTRDHSGQETPVAQRRTFT